MEQFLLMLNIEVLCQIIIIINILMMGDITHWKAIQLFICVL